MSKKSRRRRASSTCSLWSDGSSSTRTSTPSERRAARPSKPYRSRSAISARGPAGPRHRLGLRIRPLLASSTSTRATSSAHAVVMAIKELAGVSSETGRNGCAKSVPDVQSQPGTGSDQSNRHAVPIIDLHFGRSGNEGCRVASRRIGQFLCHAETRSGGQAQFGSLRAAQQASLSLPRLKPINGVDP
jgi:hypothetical protein